MLRVRKSRILGTEGDELDQEYGTTSKRYELSGMFCQTCVRKVREAFEDLEGATLIDVTVGSALVSRYPQAVAESSVLERFARAGYPAIQEETTKDPWKRFLRWMIKANEKRFGNKRPDCCDLN